MAQLAAKDLIDTTLPTVSGETVGENIAGQDDPQCRGDSSDQ